VPKWTFQLSPTPPTNDWLQRVHTLGTKRPLHHDISLSLPIDMGHPSTALDSNTPPTIWPPLKPPDSQCYGHHKVLHPTPTAKDYQGLCCRTDHYSLHGASTISASSHSVSGSKGYPSNRQQSAAHSVHGPGFDLDDAISAKQWPLEALAAAAAALSTAPATNQHSSLDLMGQPASLTRETNEDLHPQHGSKAHHDPLLSSMCHGKMASQPPPWKAQCHSLLTNLQNHDFSLMEWTLANMQSAISPLLWTMLLPFMEDYDI